MSFFFFSHEINIRQENFLSIFLLRSHEKLTRNRCEVNTPLDPMKILQTQISREIHEKIDQMAKRQMVSRAAIVRQLLAKAVEKATAEGQI